MLSSLHTALFATSPDAILITDEQGAVREANPAACQLLDFPRDELVGMSSVDLVAGGAAWIAETKARLMAEMRWRGELQMVPRHGPPVPVEAWSVLVTGPDGPLCASFLRDLSARQALEQELRASETRYRTLVEHLPGAVYLLADDEQQSPLYFSSGITAVTGETPEEAVAYHEHWHGLVHPDDRARVVAEDERTGEGGEPFRAEYRHQRKDGSYVWVHDECVPLHDETGQIAAWLGVMLDISDRVQLEAAQAENRAKSEFLGMISHELRTPMQSVLGYAALLLGGSRGPLTADQREDLQEIAQGAERVMQLIEQMLELSQIEIGGTNLAIEPVALPPLLQELRQEVAPRAAERGLALQVEIPPALPPVAADPALLRRILRHLADNAIKFTEEGSIHITAAVSDDGVAVVLRDTGIGITADALERIFEAFQQGDSGTTRRFGGAGLGLAVAHRLAVLMGGGISVESDPHGGSAFTVRLPLAR